MGIEQSRIGIIIRLINNGHISFPFISPTWWPQRTSFCLVTLFSSLATNLGWLEKKFGWIEKKCWVGREEIGVARKEIWVVRE